MNPHPAKRAKGGEDAASVTENVIAVADGVGGWAESGVDPAKFSRALCHNIDKRLVDPNASTQTKNTYITDPQRLLIDAVEDTRETGSSTCVIASLDLDLPRVYTCNLGDSGYLWLRKSGFDLVSLYRSKEQTHSFNFPY